MNRLLLSGIVFISLLAAGCDDDDSGKKQSQDNTCTEDVCKNSSTLKECKGGSYTEVACGENKECRDNKCVPAGSSSETCTADVCKNSSTLKECKGGSYTEVACGENKECRDNKCVPAGSSSETCTADVCKNSSILRVCNGGSYTDQPCEDGEICENNACVPDESKCTANQCTADFSKEYHACVNGNISTATSMCEGDTVCYYGSCIAPFEKGDACTNQNTGFCLADKAHAIVCNDKFEIAVWTCGDECLEDGEGGVDCPKKPRPKEHECEKNYRAECINNNTQVRLCKDYQIVTWDCYGATCSVDDNNAIYCPKTAGLAGLGGLESGGTYGDECNVKKYQEACIDNYYARICDKDGVVRIKPAGDCKISSDNPLKVEYTMAAPCDPSNYMPFCINDKKAIGFCAYDSDDYLTGVYKAAQCPSCNSIQDAEACMLL